MDSSHLQIGEVASLAGVSVDTVRFYERRRLLPRAPRTAGGFRIFSPDTVERVRFIKKAQELGFSLDEISRLLAYGNIGECQRVRDLLKVKLTELDAQIKAMREFRRTLSQNLAECEVELKRHVEAAECPVVEKSRIEEVKKK